MFICSVDMAAFSENADLLGFCIFISGIHRENINCAVVVLQADVLPRYGKSNSRCCTHTCNTLKGYSSRRLGVNAVRYTQETGCSLHRLIKIGQQKIGETSPGLMSLEFLSLEGMGDQNVV